MAENKRHKGHRQRMRERVQSYGLDSLAEHEALEYVLYLTNAQKDTNGIAHDLIDRFGDPPKSVENLLYIARVKSMAHHLYFTDIAQKGDTLRFTLYEKAKINVAAIPEFTASFDKHVKFTMDAKEPYFTYFLKLNTREKYVEAKDVMETFLQRAGEMLMEK